MNHECEVKNKAVPVLFMWLCLFVVTIVVPVNKPVDIVLVVSLLWLWMCCVVIVVDSKYLSVVVFMPMPVLSYYPCGHQTSLLQPSP